MRWVKDPLARRVLGGAGWSALGSVIASGVNLLAMVVLARILGKDAYGQFIVVQSTLAVAGIFAGFGLGMTATRYVAELRQRDPGRLAAILLLSRRLLVGLGVVAALSLGLASDWLGIGVFHSTQLVTPLMLSAGSVLFSSLDAYQKSILTGLESLRAFAIVTIAGAVCNLPFTIGLAIAYGLQGAALGLLIGALVQWAISATAASRALGAVVPKTIKPKALREWPILWRFALPAFLASALVAPAHWVAQVILADASGDFRQVAVLGVAMQWFGLILFLPNTAGRVVLPVLTERVTDGDRLSSRAIVVYSTIANGVIAIPLAALVAILSPQIVRAYGGEFSSSYAPLSLAALAAALVAIVTPVGTVLASASRMWLGASINAGWAAMYLGLAWTFADQGAFGIVLALCSAYAAHAVWTVAVSRRYVGSNAMNEGRGS